MTRSKICLKNMKKTLSNSLSRGYFFSRAIRNYAEKIIATMGGIIDAKKILIKRKLYHMIDVTNLNKIINWSTIKKSSRWVNVNFQAQTCKTFLVHFHNKKRGRRARFYAKYNRWWKKIFKSWTFAWTFSMSTSFKKTKDSI